MLVAISARCFYTIARRRAKQSTPRWYRRPGSTIVPAGDSDELRPTRPAARRGRAPYGVGPLDRLLAGRALYSRGGRSHGLGGLPAGQPGEVGPLARRLADPRCRAVPGPRMVRLVDDGGGG